MGELDPAYKGIRARVERYNEQRKEYEKNWSARNPGMEINWDDEEHQPWVDKHMPGDSRFDELYREADLEVRVDKRVAPIQKGVNQQIAEVEKKLHQKDELQKIGQEVREVVTNSIADMIVAAAPEYKDIIQTQDGVDISEKAQEAIKGKSEAAAEILEEASVKVHHFSQDYEMLVRMAGKLKPDPGHAIVLPSGDKFFPHSEIMSFGADLEMRYADSDPEKTKIGDRSWVSWADWHDGIDKILNDKSLKKADKEKLVKEFQSKHWALTPKQVIKAYVKEVGANTAKKLDKAGARPSPTTDDPPADPPPKPAKKTVKPDPPSAVSTPEPRRTDGPDGKQDGLSAKEVGDAFFPGVT